MRIRVDITTAMLYRLRKLCEVHHRTIEEQLLWYIDVGLDAEWATDEAAIKAKLAQRQADIAAYWAEVKADHPAPEGEQNTRTMQSRMLEAGR